MNTDNIQAYIQTHVVLCARTHMYILTWGIPVEPGSPGDGAASAASLEVAQPLLNLLVLVLHLADLLLAVLLQLAVVGLSQQSLCVCVHVCVCECWENKRERGEGEEGVEDGCGGRGREEMINQTVRWSEQTHLGRLNDRGLYLQLLLQLLHFVPTLIKAHHTKLRARLHYHTTHPKIVIQDEL